MFEGHLFFAVGQWSAGKTYEDTVSKRAHLPYVGHSSETPRQWASTAIIGWSVSPAVTSASPPENDAIGQSLCCHQGGNRGGHAVVSTKVLVPVHQKEKFLQFGG